MRLWWFLTICVGLMTTLRFVSDVGADGSAPSSAPVGGAPGSAAADPGAAAPSSAPAGPAPGAGAAEGDDKNGDFSNKDNDGGKEGADDEDDGDAKDDDGDAGSGADDGDGKGGGDDKNRKVGGDVDDEDGDNKGGKGGGDADDEDGDDDGDEGDAEGDDDGKGKGDAKVGHPMGPTASQQDRFEKDDDDRGSGSADDGDGDAGDRSGDSGDDVEDDSKADDGGKKADQGKNSPDKGSWPYHYRKRCQDKYGNPRPLATACKNELEGEICELMFPSDKDNPHARPRKCDLIGVNCLALKCARHCQICCETAAHGCGDNPEMRMNCQSRKHDCGAMPTAMRIACAGTCGLCNKGGCRDNMDGCIALRSVCRRDGFREDMEKKCARSCGFCDSKCRDTGLNCKVGKRRGECVRKGHRVMMREVCANTCDLCTNHQFSSLGGAGRRRGASLLDNVGERRKKKLARRQKVAHMDLVGKKK